MQHIIVLTARPSGLHAGDWVVNGVGRKGQCSLFEPAAVHSAVLTVGQSTHTLSIELMLPFKKNLAICSHYDLVLTLVQ